MRNRNSARFGIIYRLDHGIQSHGLGEIGADPFRHHVEAAPAVGRGAFRGATHGATTTPRYLIFRDGTAVSIVDTVEGEVAMANVTAAEACYLLKEERK